MKSRMVLSRRVSRWFVGSLLLLVPFGTYDTMTYGPQGLLITLGSSVAAMALVVVLVPVYRTWLGDDARVRWSGECV